MIGQAPAARLDYVEFFDPETLVPATEVGRGTQMALAVFVGKTRLIDNGRL
jgi:pantoate--beta-alanine ligase